MRLGRFLIQTIAILIAIAVAVLGYVTYRQYQAEHFRVDVLEKFEFANLNDMIEIFAEAPDMRCSEDHSDFNSSTRVVFHHAGTKSRFDLTDMTSGKTQYWVMDAENLYLWNEESDYVIAIDAGPESPVRPVGEAIPPLFVDALCTAWWSPDERIFELPVSKSIILYEDLQ